jgi:PKHD-type hydroxylase
LSPPECEQIIAHGEKTTWYQASIGSPANNWVDPNIRCVSSTTILVDDPNFLWLADRIIEKIGYANRDLFRFHLSGLEEPYQLLRYVPAQEGKPNGHYNWHQDFGAGLMGTRKLSLIIQLSKSETYEGCRLRMMTHMDFEVPYTNQGDGIAFPSWAPHCITPITSGVRYALVLWIHGPQFC